MKRLLLFLVAFLPACSFFQGATRIDGMTAEEFAGYASRTTAQVQAITSTALAEGDLTPEAALLVANALQGFADGTTAPALGALAEHLDLRGWGALALLLTIVELDASLEELGAYGPGWERGRTVIAAVAGGIKAAVGA